MDEHSLKNDSEPINEAARWRVGGLVQGVGFRWSTLSLAERLDIAGWVRNLSDGSVEVAARGTKTQLRALEEFLKQGPPLARVRYVEKLDPSPEITTVKIFEIR